MIPPQSCELLSTSIVSFSCRAVLPGENQYEAHRGLPLSGYRHSRQWLGKFADVRPQLELSKLDQRPLGDNQSPLGPSC